MHPFILNDDACIQVNVHNSMKHDKSLKYKSQHNNAHLHDRQLNFFLIFSNLVISISSIIISVFIFSLL